MHKTQNSDTPPAVEISFGDFLKTDIRIGTIVRAENFPQTRKPAYKIWVNFGSGIGVKQSSAQITEHYSFEDLQGRVIAAVVNFPPRQIGPFTSEVLILGFPDNDGKIVLFAPDTKVPKGARLA